MCSTSQVVLTSFTTLMRGWSATVCSDGKARNVYSQGVDFLSQATIDQLAAADFVLTSPPPPVFADAVIPNFIATEVGCRHPAPADQLFSLLLSRLP